MKFLILIGSHARGDADSFSDIDLLLINLSQCEFDYSSLIIGDLSLVNEVHYDLDTFWRLYSIGSLFLHHAFTEGSILYGDEKKWCELKRKFAVQKNFHNELLEINRTTNLLSHTNIFGGKYLTPLVNSFTELKNACIFSLAHNGIYAFNKSKCFDLSIGFSDREVQFKDLKAFYDYSIRGIDLQLPFDSNNEIISTSLLRDINTIVKEMCHASQ
jgi:predicted nucleotidyltransferase